VLLPQKRGERLLELADAWTEREKKGFQRAGNRRELRLADVVPIKLDLFHARDWCP
jgi:hypothetical protein